MNLGAVISTVCDMLGLDVAGGGFAGSKAS